MHGNAITIGRWLLNGVGWQLLAGCGGLEESQLLLVNRVL